jgi:hypothetical protein
VPKAQEACQNARDFQGSLLSLRDTDTSLRECPCHPIHTDF